MVKLSVAIIAHNEAHNLPAALASVSWADQLVVVDCESSDGSIAIAEQSGAEVYYAPNRPNLNINKNIAIEHCRGEWVLVLDADERVPDPLAGQIRRVINEGNRDGYLIPRCNHVLDRRLRYGGQYPDRQLRLFRQGRGRFPAEHIHERVRVEGTVGKLSEPLEHHPYRSYGELMRKGAFYVEFEAQRLHALNRRVSGAGLIWKSGVKPILRFNARFIFKGGFLDGAPGFMAAYFDAWNQAARWLRLWELSRQGIIGVPACKKG